jgi:tRNA-2-methylthio-N6-dimethylallyladenosine synthase
MQLVSDIKRYIPDIRLTTDMIVGFPGEREEDFEKSKNLVKDVGFDMVYLGKYSPRKGSLSFKMDDVVPQKVKKEREIIIRDLVNEIRDKHHSEFIGKEIKVLVVGGRKALSFYNHEIILDKILPLDRIGTFISVKVVGSSLSGLVAKAN